MKRLKLAIATALTAVLCSMAIAELPEPVLDRSKIPTTYDSVGVLPLNTTLFDTAYTFAASSNIDQGAGDTITVFFGNGSAFLFEDVIVQIFARILNGGNTGDTLRTYNDSTLCTESDTNVIPNPDTVSNYFLGCCDTASDTTAYNDWLNDSTSAMDSTTGYVVMDQSDGSARLGDLDTVEVFSLLDSLTFTAQGTWTASTLSPTKPYLRFRVQKHANTEIGDTIHVQIRITRINPINYVFGPPMPDYIGTFFIQEFGATDSTTTISNWLHPNIDHVIGDPINLTYGGEDGGGFYDRIIMQIDTTICKSIDADSIAGFICLDQSLDRNTWYPQDSIRFSSGDFPVLDSLAVGRLPFGRFRSQVIDSTDEVTGIFVTAKGQRVK